jgi:UDPglucose--hexose-1-phosphate uridylyltransferase
MRDEPDELSATSPGASVVAEFRQDTVSGNHVLVAPSRSARPTTASRFRRPLAVVSPTAAVADGGCPFCPGNEEATGPEVVRTGPDTAEPPGWRVRVVQNRYPVVGGAQGATGQCEVVIFRSHDDRLEDLEVHQVAEILAVIRDRVAAQATRRASVQIFVNAEADAGASIGHPHAQIIGLDFVPPAVELEFEMIASCGTDPLQLDLDRAQALDLIVADGRVTAWCPWAMPLPFAVRIASRVPTSSFVELSADDIAATAQALRDVLRAVNEVLDRPAYNVVIFTDQYRGDLHRRWRIEIVPRITVGGGFEICTAVTTHSTEAVVASDTLRRQLERIHESPAGNTRRIGTYS